MGDIPIPDCSRHCGTMAVIGLPAVPGDGHVGRQRGQRLRYRGRGRSAVLTSGDVLDLMSVRPHRLELLA
jgi:hypothetical protein